MAEKQSETTNTCENCINKDDCLNQLFTHKAYLFCGDAIFINNDDNEEIIKYD